ncbi:hypothetical protein WEH80_40555 [Actinomycetes bacterium KLBMP 9759]
MSTILLPEDDRTYPAQFDTAVDLPFPPLVNDRSEAALPGHIEWLSKKTGLMSRSDVLQRYLEWRGPELGVRWYPECSTDDLQLGMDLMAWLFVLDDYYAKPDVMPEEARATFDQLMGVLRRPPGTPVDGPTLVTAFADLWVRECDPMTPAWRRRAAVNWEEYLQCYVVETDNRTNDAELSVDEYLVLREKSGIMYVLLDSQERIDHCELPDAVLAAEPVQQMRSACIWISNYDQDILSFDKEEAHGDRHNLVFVLERRRGCTRQQAIDEVRRLIDEQVELFLSAERKVPALKAELGLDEETAARLDAYVQSLRAGARACDDWCRTSNRYSA